MEPADAHESEAELAVESGRDGERDWRAGIRETIQAMRWNVPLRIALAAVVAAAAAVLFGKLRWEAGTRRLRARLEAARAPVEPAVWRRRSGSRPWPSSGAARSWRGAS